MARIQETVETGLPLDRVFNYVADLENIEQWDPGVARSVKRSNGPLQVGSIYDLDVAYNGRTIPMAYTVTAYKPKEQIAFVGEGSSVHAVDTIDFTETDTGTRVVYTADISLKGLLRLAEPFLGKRFEAIGTDAANGLQQRLAAMA